MNVLRTGRRCSSWPKNRFYIICNVDYAPMDALLDNAEREGFLKSPHRKAILRADNPADMLKLMVGKHATLHQE